MRAHAWLAASLLLGCSGVEVKANVGGAGSDRPKALTRSADLKGSGGERCDATGEGRDVSEYDTNGDGQPDVRKVFKRMGDDVDQRVVMICRETDVDGDGIKDVIRYYDDEGRALREEADRNLDRRMDLSIVFQDGKLVRREVDSDHDGKIDVVVYYQNGEPIRAERDLAGRSTADKWHPDRWEYYEKGRVVRMGTDVDGDSRVDRWDRDATYKRPDEEDGEQGGEEAEPEGGEGAGEQGEGGEPEA
jgi:hypothetical protein